MLRLFAPLDDAAPSPTSVSAVVAAYLEHLERVRSVGGYKPSSRRGQVDTLNDFVGAYGHREADSLRQADLASWVLSHEAWVSPHTHRNRSALVVACFRWAAREGLVDACRFSRGEWAKAIPREAMTEEEFVALVAATKRPANGRRSARRALRWMVIALWETGARTCELRDSLWRDLDLERGLLVLDDSKTGERRTIVLTQPLRRFLRAVQARLAPAPSARIFLNSYGRPWIAESFARLFRRYAAIARVRQGVTPYSLRHGFCVRALDAGLGERQIADLMGHAGTTYVGWYGKSAGRRVEYLRGLLDQLE